MKRQPKSSIPLTSDPDDKGVAVDDAPGVFIRFHPTDGIKGYRSERKPRFLFKDPAGQPPEGWALPDSHEETRLREEIEARVAANQRPPARALPGSVLLALDKPLDGRQFRAAVGTGLR